MKKNYSIFKTLLFAAFAMLSLSASAGESAYYWSYVRAEAYPSGKGTVYLKNAEAEDPTDADYKEVFEDKYVHSAYSASTKWTGYAKASEGANFVGWTTVADYETYANNNYKIDESVLSSNIISSNEVTELSADAMVSTDSEVGDSYPLDPDAVFVAVFGNVKFDYVTGQKDYLGTASISKLASEVGDQVTITATPTSTITYDDEGNPDGEQLITFEYWTDEDGNKVTDNPYTFTVTGPKTYTPHFAHQYGGTYNFPETGALMLYTSPYVTLASDAYEAGQFGLYTIKSTSFADKERATQALDYGDYETGYVYQFHDNQGAIIYGKGEFTLQLDPNNEYTMVDEDDYLVSDPMGYDIEDMPTEGQKYYVLADDHKFHQVVEGYIDESRWALILPDSVGVNTVTIDFYIENLETADNRLPILNAFDLSKFVLADQTAIQDVEATESKTLQQLFDLGGRLVSDRQKGIIIKNGKKTLVK